MGQNQPQAIYEIMGRKGTLTPQQIELRTRYNEGLRAYRNKHWEEARAAFSAAQAAAPTDGPSATMLKRIEAFAAAPPSNSWDGAWRLEQK